MQRSCWIKFRQQVPTKKSSPTSAFFVIFLSQNTNDESRIHDEFRIQLKRVANISDHKNKLKTINYTSKKMALDMTIGHMVDCHKEQGEIIAEVGNSPPTISVGRADAFFTEDMGV